MKTILITGTSSGIGKAAAKYFAENGWNVAATMRNPDKDNEVKNFKNTKVYSLDVTSARSIEEAILLADNDFGRIDVVVNNAGFAVDGVFEVMTDEVILKQFDTNVFGLMRVTRSFIAYFRKKGGGSILQVTSMGGRLAFPLYSIYHSTKWAVEGFTESLQYEVKPFNIRMKIIEPGVIKTEFYGTSRHFVKPTEFKDYDTFVEKCEKVSMEAGNNGENPLIVAAEIFKAANAKNCKMRYAIGKPAPMLLILRKMIPDSWWFKVVGSSYKI